MTDHEKLESLISEAKFLTSQTVTAYNPEVQAWYSKAERFLIKKFGQDSFEYKDFKNIRFTPSIVTSNTDLIRKCIAGLNTAILIFQSYLDEMNENNTTTDATQKQGTYDKIFIVHGHDGEIKQSVARIVEKQGIEAVILSEKANQGRTIIEKFEDYSDVDGAICLFTADDLGREKNGSSDNLRARQNVVLETGYFMGKLGRKCIVILADEQVEMPSDLSGVVYTNTDNWQIDLLKELKAMGYSIDFNIPF